MGYQRKKKDRRKFLEDLHDGLKFLGDYAPVVLISAAMKKQGTRGLFALIQ